MEPGDPYDTLLLLLSVGLPVANAPDVLHHVAYCTTLDVQILTSRLTKRS